MRICAWCRKEMPSRGETGPVTHGICPACAGGMGMDVPISLQDHIDDLDAPVLVVDGNARVSLANHLAVRIIGAPLVDLSRRRLGDVFGCIHARTPEGCGRTIHCSACAIRSSVEATYRTGEPRVRVPATLRQGDPDDPSAVALAITTVRRGDMVLLMLRSVEP